MQQQRFTLQDGDVAIISPGVLTLTSHEPEALCEVDLKGVRRVSRERSVVTVHLQHTHVEIRAQSLVDAGEIEANLRTAAAATGNTFSNSGEIARWMGLITFVAIIVLVGTIAFRSTRDARRSESDMMATSFASMGLAPAPASSGSRVTYILRGSTTQDSSFSWLSDTGERERASDTLKGWSRVYVFDAGTQVQMTVANNDDDATSAEWIECRIEINGEVADEERVYGAPMSARCSATVP